MSLSAAFAPFVGGRDYAKQYGKTDLQILLDMRESFKYAQDHPELYTDRKSLEDLAGRATAKVFKGSPVDEAYKSARADLEESGGFLGTGLPWAGIGLAAIVILALLFLLR